MKYTNLLISLLLFVHGLYSLYASYKGKKTIHFELPSTTYLSEKIFGKHFDRWHNFFWGVVEVILGGTLFLAFLKN